MSSTTPARASVPSTPPTWNPTYSCDYLLAPQANAVATVVLLSGSFSSTDATQTSISCGTLGATSGTALNFTIYNISAYAEGYVTIQYPTGPAVKGVYPTATEECHLNFFLALTTDTSATGVGWQQDTKGAFPGDNLTILPPSCLGSDHPTPILLNPSQGSGGNSGIDSLYQVLNPQIVFLVDCQANGNMLFRGNTPFAAPLVPNGNQAVDFKELHAYMKTCYETQYPDAPAKFPAMGSYVLRDICVQDPSSEGGSMTMELNGFLPSGTQPGSVPLTQIDQAWYPLTDATPTPLRQMSNWQIEPHDNSSNDTTDQQTAKQLNTWMQQTETLPHIYYIHCASGHDRTGILAATYLMYAYPSISLQQAFIQGTTINYVATPPPGGQIHSGCVDIDQKGNPADNTRSRLFLIADIYNQTITDIYNLINNPAPPATLPAPATQTTPPFVYSTYPWQS